MPNHIILVIQSDNLKSSTVKYQNCTNEVRQTGRQEKIGAFAGLFCKLNSRHNTAQIFIGLSAMFIKAALCVATLALSININAASVWKVSKGDDSIFVGGTIHFLSESDYPLPKEYEVAYSQSDTLVFETDIAIMNTPEFQQTTMKMMFLTDGKTINDFITKDTFAKLDAHLTERNIPVQNFLTFKPGFLAITLSIIELQMMGINSSGVDMYYSTKAIGDGKKQLWFETPEQQMEMLGNMGKGEEDAMIVYTLDEVEHIRTEMPKLMNAWKLGDMDKMEALGITEMKAEYPKVYDEILAQRNRNWIPKINDLFGNDSTEFVLVGGLHLAGPDSVLAMLSKQGYKITKL